MFESRSLIHQRFDHVCLRRYNLLADCHFSNLIANCKRRSDIFYEEAWDCLVLLLSVDPVPHCNS